MKAVRRNSVIASLIVMFVQLFVPASMAVVVTLCNALVNSWANT